MPPANILITGCDAGVGLYLVKEFLKIGGVRQIFATIPTKEDDYKLKKVEDERVVIIPMDITDDKSIEEGVKTVEKKLGEDGLNLLINNAGVVVPYDFYTKTPQRSEFNRQLEINTVSPVMVSQYFFPLLKKAAKSNFNGELTASGCGIINISSISGSIARNNPADPWFNPIILGYRASKAALNCITRDLALHLKGDGVLVTAFCPGTTKTDESGKENATQTSEDSAALLVKSILKLKDEHTGNFYQNDLQPIPF